VRKNKKEINSEEIWMKKIIWTIFLIGTIAISGCVQKAPSELERAKAACINACKKALAEGQDLSTGPCLLNPMDELPNWVCDVAHEPREAIDNLPENQCSAYREGRASHFVEVDPNCNFIRAV